MDLPEIDRLVAINQKWGINTIMLPVQEVCVMSTMLKKQEQALADSNLAMMEQTDLAEKLRQINAAYLEAGNQVDETKIRELVDVVKRYPHENGPVDDLVAHFALVKAGSAQPAPATPAASVDSFNFMRVACAWAKLLKHHDHDYPQELHDSKDALIAYIDAHTARAVAEAEKQGFVSGYAKATVEHNQRVACSPEPTAPQQHAQAVLLEALGKIARNECEEAEDMIAVAKSALASHQPAAAPAPAQPVAEHEDVKRLNLMLRHGQSNGQFLYIDQKCHFLDPRGRVAGVGSDPRASIDDAISKEK